MMDSPPSGTMWPECSTTFPPRMRAATAGWALKSSSIWHRGALPWLIVASMPATRPSDTDARFVYTKPPPNVPFVAYPLNSQAAPSSSDPASARSVMTFAGSSMVCLMPTATALAGGRFAPTACSVSSEFTPSHSSTTSAVISSSPARTPHTLPASSLMSASTAMPQMYSAPASSAFEASH